jgi:hypothetical protein
VTHGAGMGETMRRSRFVLAVAELFAGRTSTVSNGKPQAYMNLERALGVEVSGGHLCASGMAPRDKAGNPSGQVRGVEFRR